MARLVLAYYEALSRKDLEGAEKLFFPESIKVARPEGGVVIEGRSAEIRRHLADELPRARPVRRIVLLRRVATELLENTYREIWLGRFRLAGPDSATTERRVHVLQQLGADTRWLGRLERGPRP